MQHIDGLIDLPCGAVWFVSQHCAGRSVDTADAMRRRQPIDIRQILRIREGQFAQVIEVDRLQCIQSGHGKAWSAVDFVLRRGFDGHAIGHDLERCQRQIAAGQP